MKFLTMTVMRKWKGLPRKFVTVSSLDVFMARMDGALSNLFYWKMSLPMADGVEPDDLYGRFQPK